VSGQATGAFSKSLEPVELTVSAQVAGTELPPQTIRRLAVAPGVEREPIARDGVQGTLFTPAEPGPRPALVVLSGSEGGGYEPSAAAYAAMGYTTLALSFFGVEGLPAQLVEVPLETVERAIAWLSRHPRVKPDAIGIWGVSKGAELALLAASHIPQVRAVVAKSPSAVAFEGLSDDLGKHHRSSWTYRGEPVPFVPVTFTAGIGASYGWSRLRHKPWSTTPMYAHALEDAEAVRRAAIAVEDIGGPLLLTSGGHDGAWPSGPMSELIIERRRAHGHTDDVHLHYAEAGHQIAAPYTPTTISWFVVAGGMIEDLGGTPAGNAAASADSWPRINAFLAQHLPT
jgi:dienelactone hydrolase